MLGVRMWWRAQGQLAPDLSTLDARGGSEVAQPWFLMALGQTMHFKLLAVQLTALLLRVKDPISNLVEQPVRLS